MDAKRELEELLKASGAVLKRANKHQVWELPDGRKFTHASTPGDVRAWDNALCNLRKLLGIKRQVRKNPDRRAKPGVGKQRWAPVEMPTPQARFNKAMELLEKYYDKLAFIPKPCCVPVDVRRVPMTPLWCILRNLVGYGGQSPNDSRGPNP